MTNTDPVLVRRAGYSALAEKYRALAKFGKSVGLVAAFIQIAEGYESLAEASPEKLRGGGRVRQSNMGMKKPPR